MEAIAFLDRDGTIIKDYPDEEWRTVTEPEFMEGAITGMKALGELGFRFIVVTNQYIISDGIITLEDYESVHGKFIDTLRMHGIEILQTYYCPHNDADGCACKKPLPGMIHQAMKEFEIDMERSVLCGNTDADYQLAKCVGLPFYGVRYEGKETVRSFRSLLEVAEEIAAERR